MSQCLEFEEFGLKHWVCRVSARSESIFVAESTGEDADNVSTSDPKNEQF